MRAACTTCGVEWPNDRRGLPGKAPACFGTDGHDHRVWYEDDESGPGVPLVTFTQASKGIQSSP